MTGIGTKRRLGNVRFCAACELYGRKPAGAASMSPYSIDDPKHWLERAKEARALAEQIDDPEVKRIIRQNADDYERLAKRAEERSVGRWPKSK